MKPPRTTRGSTRNVTHGGACDECTSNCTLHHRNHKDPSTSVERFFRIMLGPNFTQVMFLPLIVACKWRKYIDSQAFLEDTTGEKYPVKISEVNNTVAFKEGWYRFSADHQLEEGDFLIFNRFIHVEKLHFIVHVFGRSGLEKNFFSRGHDMKVPLPTMNRNAALLNKTLEVGVMSNVSKNSPVPSVVPEPLPSDIHHDSRTTNTAHGDYTDGKMLQQAEPAPWDSEPFYMLPRDDLCIEDRTCLYDLSSFENNDHLAASVVSIGNDESGTINHAEKTMEPQRDSDLLDMFPLKKNSSNPEPQLYKKQNGIIDLDLLDMLPVKRKFAGQEPQPYKKQNVLIENNNGSTEMKMIANDGGKFSTHVPKMIEPRDIFGPADNIPVQRDVSGSITPSCKAMLENKKNVDTYGSASSAQDKTQKVSAGGIIASAPLDVTPLMQMAARDGEKSKTHELKIIEYQDRDGPAETINVQTKVSLAKTPSHKAKLIKMNDMSGPDSSAQYTRQTVATGGGAIKTIKKELVLEDELFCHQQYLNVKKQTISPENVRRHSSKIKKNVKIPKAEPFCSERISSTFVGRESSSAEVEDKPYLLLQSELPSVLSPREKLRTIYLRAEDKKVLPVTYLQKNGVRVLTSGWHLFKSMYHLHAGDRCRIELEDASKRIYRFDVISRGTVMNLK